MSPLEVMLPLLATIGVSVAWLVGRWEAANRKEAIYTRLGTARTDAVRWSRTDAVLLRLPVLGTLGRRAHDARLPLGVMDLVLLTGVLAVGLVQLGIILLGPTGGRVVGLLVAPILVWSVVGALAGRRRQQIEDQIPDLVRLLAGSAGAGLSLTGALTHAASQVADPLSSEMRRVVAQMELGTSMSDALEDFNMRVRTQDLEVVVWALSIQHRTGGDLVRLLNQLADGITATHRAARDARAILAPVAFQAYLCLALGLGALVIINRITGGGLERALDKPLTIAVLGVSASLLLLSVMLVRHFVSRVRT